MKSFFDIFIKSWCRFFMGLIGTALLGVVVAFLTKAHLGVDPFTDFVAGIASLFGSTYSVFFLIVTGLLLVLDFFWDKRKLGIVTVINLFAVGTVFSFAIRPLNYFFPEPLLWQRFLFLFIALVILCFASSLYMTSDLGVSSYDAVAIILSEKTRFQFRWCRIFTDLICVIVGFVCGADVGIGTVITAFCMGPFTQWCCEHFAQPLLKRFDS